jgi:membrane protease YdiL (CAAX protease family)
VHARRPGRRPAALFAGSVALLLSVWNNAVVPRLPDRWYVPVNLSTTAVLLAAARRSGSSWVGLGFDRDQVRAGLRWGGVPAGVVAVAYAGALSVPAARPLLADARVAGLGRADVVRQVLVRIPLGTVVWEEVAFRGVLLAALLRVLPARAAVLVSAGLFGVWHVQPTRSALAANDLAPGPLPTAVAVTAGCLTTGAAGWLFAELRLRSGSLLAPALLHLAANDLGLLAAAWAQPPSTAALASSSARSAPGSESQTIPPPAP